MKGEEHTPGAEAPSLSHAERPKAEALGYLEAKDFKALGFFVATPTVGAIFA